MNVFDFAMELEKEGEKYYRELADRSKHAGCRNIFTMLADDEVKHFNVFKEMKQNSDPEFQKTRILDEARKTFVKMASEGNPFETEMLEVDLYRKALDMEKKSKDFYVKEYEELENVSQKAIFKKIADEEETHFRIIEKIVDFISKPETFLENAEFFQQDDY